MYSLFFFFFQAEDGIRDYKVTGVQTCALPISPRQLHRPRARWSCRGGDRRGSPPPPAPPPPPGSAPCRCPAPPPPPACPRTTTARARPRAAPARRAAPRAPGTRPPDCWRGCAPPRPATARSAARPIERSEEHTSELQSPCNLVCRLLLEKKKERRYIAQPK